MNQKAIMVILVVAVVALASTTIYFAIINKASQPVVPVVKVTQQPTQPIASQPIVCGKLTQFKNESWANNLDALYKNSFLKPQGLARFELWPRLGEPTMAGELSSCKIKDIFIFIPEYFQFGCGSILKYDIKNNKLAETIVQPPTACADSFGQITDTYVEYFGWMGDGAVTDYHDYHGRYYFNEDRIENIK